jgi:hypothetical protein
MLVLFLHALFSTLVIAAAGMPSLSTAAHAPMTHSTHSRLVSTTALATSVTTASAPAVSASTHTATSHSAHAAHHPTTSHSTLPASVLLSVLALHPLTMRAILFLLVRRQ